MNWRITPRPPLRATAPSSGTRSPATIRSSVVFPAPFSPTSAARAPSPTRKETPSSSTRPSGRVCRTPVTSTKPTPTSSGSRQPECRRAGAGPALSLRRGVRTGSSLSRRCLRSASAPRSAPRSLALAAMLPRLSADGQQPLPGQSLDQLGQRRGRYPAEVLTAGPDHGADDLGPQSRPELVGESGHGLLDGGVVGQRHAGAPPCAWGLGPAGRPGRWRPTVTAGERGHQGPWSSRQPTVAYRVR